ncbi:MAG TPA: tetratricopeptide repeat protein, partial [Polyangiales bacterium]|nr:tetratricopeptide repeat protein [Polyangiales bacterium]
AVPESVAAAPPRPAQPTARAVAPASSSEAPSTRADAPRPDAQSLLRAAASARSAADYDRAAELYQRLLDEYPRSAEASIARVPYARLLCQRLDEAEDAFALFESYLRDEPHGSLRQEAQSGLAQCLDRDGRSAEASSVWRQLLREHPDSIYAKRARARLGAR